MSQGQGVGNFFKWLLPCELSVRMMKFLHHIYKHYIFFSWFRVLFASCCRNGLFRRPDQYNIFLLKILRVHDVELFFISLSAVVLAWLVMDFLSFSLLLCPWTALPTVILYPWLVYFTVRYNSTFFFSIFISTSSCTIVSHDMHIMIYLFIRFFWNYEWRKPRGPHFTKYKVN